MFCDNLLRNEIDFGEATVKNQKMFKVHFLY